ncbi:hypothetical protein [Nonomuraea sp. NPDC049695]
MTAPNVVRVPFLLDGSMKGRSMTIEIKKAEEVETTGFGSSC